MIRADLDLAISALERRLKKLENIRGGRGVIVENAPGGVMISARTPAAVARSRREDNSGGTLLVLGFTQGQADTDSWSRAGDDRPVKITVVTDVQYDTTTHKLTLCGRDLTYDRGGNLSSVSGESTVLVEITEAVGHT